MKNLKQCQPLKTNFHKQLFISGLGWVAPSVLKTASVILCPAAKPEKHYGKTHHSGWRLEGAKRQPKGKNPLESQPLPQATKLLVLVETEAQRRAHSAQVGRTPPTWEVKSQGSPESRFLSFVSTVTKGHSRALTQFLTCPHTWTKQCRKTRAKTKEKYSQHIISLLCLRSKTSL